MRRNLWLIAGLVVVLSLMVVACGDSSDPVVEEPSAVPTQEPSPTVILAAPTRTPSGPTLTPSPTLPPTVTPLPTAEAPAATSTPLPTDTPGPYEHVIEAGDFCLRIAAKYGHEDPDVISEIERINNVNCSALPGPGNTILVPIPTATPTQIGADLTQTVVATSAPPLLQLEPDKPISMQSYSVREGDTLVSISINNDTTLRQLCELNPLPGGLDCGACVWESANCCCPRDQMPLLSVGQSLNVPAPTPTPTMTATFTGSETPTLTPTHTAPQPVYPPNGATLTGRVRLTWLADGPLVNGEIFLVTVRNETTGSVLNETTRQLSLDVPAAYLPEDGQSHMLVWQVSVVRQDDAGLLVPVSWAVPEQRFTWTSGS